MRGRWLGRSAFCLLQVISFSWCAEAGAKANLYVNSSGAPACSDRTSKADNSAATPWCSIHRAAVGTTFGGSANATEAAAAGDTVFITCGSYEAEAKDAVFHVALNPVNEGAAGAPIRFQSASGARDCIRVTRRAGSSPGGSVIGSVNRDYIEWAGFDLRESDWGWAPRSGYQNGLVLFHGDPAITGARLEDSTLTGTAAPDRSGDNYTGLRVHGASATVRNNVISTFGTEGHNNSCSTWYFGNSMLVEHNVLKGCGAGIYVKNNSGLSAGASPHVIRNNVIEPNTVGILLFENTNGTAEQPVLVHHNLISGGSGTCIQALWIGTGQDARHAKIFNNTCVDQREECFRISGPPAAGAGFEFWNNICAGQPTMVLGTAGARAADLDITKVRWEHNVYFGFRTFANWQDIGTIEFGEWQRRYGQDQAAPAGAVRDPRFAGAKNGDYRLAAGSTALAQGRAKFAIGAADGSTIAAGAFTEGGGIVGREPERR